MLNKLHLTNGRSAANGVAPKPGTESTQVLPAELIVRLPADAEPASARILEAQAVIRNLLVEDDLRANGLLLGSVAVDLNEILLEFDQISGLQRMFEAVMQDKCKWGP